MANPMKVLQLSTYDRLGGAGIAAYRLHTGLREIGCDSRMLVKVKSVLDPEVITVVNKPPGTILRRVLSERWARYLRERNSKDGIPDEVFSDCHSRYRPDDFSTIDNFDLIHLHWTTDLLDWPSTLANLASKKPLVWTLHDMNPFCGVLHYQDKKIKLPAAFGRWDAAVLSTKKRVLDGIPANRLRLVAPSTWMAKEVAASELMGRFRVDVVPNGLDTREYIPVENRQALRKLLGIPLDKIVVGFIAQNLSERRKGFHLLADALKGSISLIQDACLVTVGASEPTVVGFNHYHLGSTDNYRILKLFYNAIDVFLCPSVADNLPNTILEAMSCGTPTVAFDVGGIPDMVRPGITGWLAQPVGSSRELGSAIEMALLSHEDRHKFGSNCRAIANSEYTEAMQAARVIAIYKEILNRAN
jgi:glycosyltransferase involved in cell wall biosynthesis